LLLALPLKLLRLHLLQGAAGACRRGADSFLRLLLLEQLLLPLALLHVQPGALLYRRRRAGGLLRLALKLLAPQHYFALLLVALELQRADAVGRLRAGADGPKRRCAAGEDRERAHP